MAIRRGRGAATTFLQDFQAFALKGNVIDLAVAVIIGGAFGKIVSSFVEDIIMPLVNPLIPGGDWRKLILPPGIKVGNFIGSIVDFLIIALILFIVIRLLTQFQRTESLPPPPNTRDCPYCFEAVPLAASRCRACTSELTPQAPL